MNKFIREAEENFDNFLGDAAGEYIGGEEMYVGDYMDDDYYNGGEGGLGDIDSADRTITVNISNSDTANQLTAFVFGAYANNTQPVGITVTVPESSHDQVRQELLSNPFLIKGFKYIVTNVAQFSNTITIRRTTSMGISHDAPLQPNSYRSAQNQITTQIDAPSYVLAVDGRCELRVPQNASESTTWIFSVQTKGNIGQLLKGQAVLDVARTQAPTGLPQIDIKLKRRK